MKGDRVEAVVDTGAGGTQTFEIVATRAGRRIEITTAFAASVEVTEVDPRGNPVPAPGPVYGESPHRAGRASRRSRATSARVDIETTQQYGTETRIAPDAGAERDAAPTETPRQLTVLGDDSGDSA